MNTEGDTEPIGIILGADHDKVMLHYALQNISNQLFVSRYQLYLPNREQMEAELARFTAQWEKERAESLDRESSNHELDNSEDGGRYGCKETD